MRLIRELESSRPNTSPPRNEPLAMRHSASVMPSRATAASTSLVTFMTSAKRSGWHAAYTDSAPLSAKMSSAE
ncbi:Uncharacterised protein [Mycobacterium tuberculosis]|nr:Uncharacterised protein [Mycobacterium tuberculosis]